MFVLEVSDDDVKEEFDKTDDSLLSKIDNLQKDNAQSSTDLRNDMEVKTLHITTEKRIDEMDVGNQQLLNLTFPLGLLGDGTVMLVFPAVFFPAGIPPYFCNTPDHPLATLPLTCVYNTLGG